MAELETALRQLGAELEFPPTPDLASAIRGRLERPRAWRRPVLIGLAVLVVAIGAALAVPSARTAILDWLGLRNVSVVRVDELPPARPLGRLDLGREVTLAEAKRRADWLRVPARKPDHVYVSDLVPGGRLTLLWGTPSEVRLLLTETSGRAFIEKMVEGESEVEPVDIGDGGAWFEGRTHRDVPGPRRHAPREHGRGWRRARSPGSSGDVTLRLEGNISKDEALRLARDIQ